MVNKRSNNHMTDLQALLPEPYSQEPDRYRVNRNGSITDITTHRFIAGAGRVPVPPSQDTRFTPDSSHPHSGSKLALRKHELTRERVREAIIAEAIKAGGINHTQGAADAIALGVAAIWSESNKDEHSLGDRIKAQRHVIRIAEPGLMLDERQRSGEVLQGGMRIELSEGAAAQLLSTLAGVAPDVIEGESREVAGSE